MQKGDFNLYTHFEEQLRACSEKELLRTGAGESWSYGDVEILSARMASGLSSLGAEPGDRVSVQVEKSPECLCLYLACLRAGLVYHPLNMAYKATELGYFLTDAEPRIVICDERNESTILAIAERADAGEVLTLNADGSGRLRDLAAAASDDFRTRRRERNDLAALLYSSGTTGVPKGIKLSHFNLLSNTRTLVSAWGFTAADRLLHALPVFHVHGLFVAIGCVLLSGSSMRWLSRFSVADVLRHLPECTVMMGVPTYYTRLLAEPALDRAVTANVRLFTSGSAPLRTETFLAFEERTGHRILERYGMTETNMNTSNPLDGVRKPGTVGPALPGVEVRVTDDEGKPLPAGDIGNLEVRGPNVFRGYWKLPEKTAEDFAGDGFFRTGDKGVIDNEGYVAIVGRSKDVIITGGLNVYPKEVERIIDELPGISESAVIGAPHPDLGEGVVAIVVAESDSVPNGDDLIALCRQRLAGFKIPKKVFFLDELPRNAMAKVQKNRLREAYRGVFES